MPSLFKYLGAARDLCLQIRLCCIAQFMDSWVLIDRTVKKISGLTRH
jgi:hypothetical protein